jgi:hypothetical protein
MKKAESSLATNKMVAVLEKHSLTLYEQAESGV